MNLPLEFFDFFVQLFDFTLVMMLFTLVRLFMSVVVFIDRFCFKKVRFENGTVFLLCAIVISLGNRVRSLIKVESLNVGGVFISRGSLRCRLRNRLSDLLLHAYKN